jgi:peptide/nickel transport system substrate-binding protein
MVFSTRVLLIASVVGPAGLATSCSSPTKPPAEDAPVSIRWSRDPETLDPLGSPNQNAGDAQVLLHVSLLTVNPLTKKFEPFLAANFPTVRYEGNARTYLTYHLRPEAKWDTGSPITAADVVFTFKLFFCQGVPNQRIQPEVAFVENVTTDPADPLAVTLVCRGKSPDYVSGIRRPSHTARGRPRRGGALRKVSLEELRGQGPAQKNAELASLQARIAARYQAAKPAQHPENLGAAGPYSLKEYQRDRRLVFVRKKNWWGAKFSQSPVFAAKASQLVYVIVPDESTASLALTNGQLDVLPGVPARVFERLQKSAASREKLAFYTSPTYEIMTAGFNTSRPALSDARTRVALSYLFDAEQLNQASQLGKGVRTVGLISPEQKQNYNDSLELLNYNPNLASRLLTEAGWRRNAAGWQRQRGKEPAQELRLQLRYRAGESNYELVALQFASAARSLGIPVSLSPTESAVLRSQLQQGEYDVYVQSIKGNPFLFNLLPLFGTQAIGEGNSTRFGTPQTDRLLEAAATAESEQARARLLRRIQVMMRQEMPIVPLYFVANRVVARREVAGLNVTSLKPGYVARTMYHQSSAPLP